MTKINVICGVIYRQHNSPERSQSYFEETIENLPQPESNLKTLGDFNIDFKKFETSQYSILVSLQLENCYLVPTIDKPTRVRNHGSATLIDNIFANS